ncbi:hypothetical protein ABMA28_009496 [Loxostege sticticalis]|uniref:Integrase catalytic domain-containing protein n=1 Tax=Loxostege sticticalis TaxID=481309 RepID=A0ABD0SDJ2_LOXSC
MGKGKRRESEPFVGESVDTNKNQLTLYIVKRDVIFKRLENIFNLAQKAELNPQIHKVFCANASNIDKLRNDYQEVLDSYNMLNLQMDPHSEVDYDSWTSFEEMYCYIKQVLLDIEKHNLNSNSQPPPPTKSQPRLPPIDLMSFNGDIKNWPLFYQQFKSMIHDNATLTDSEKVFYLVNKLTGQALCVCAGLAPTAENYIVIWDALVQKYDDPRSLACAYLNQLLHFKPLNNTSSTGLDSFINNFDSSVEALKQLKLSDLTDFIFLHLALQKLDTETIKLFEITYRKDKIPTYHKLIEFIKEQSKVLSRSVPNNKSANNFSHPQNKVHSKHSPTPYTKSFVNTELGSGPSNTSVSDKCALCNNKQHEHLYSCPSFMKLTPHDRFTFIKNNNFCNNCLSVKHKTFSCTSKHNCSHCSMRHHSLLHFHINVKSNNCNIGAAVVSDPAIIVPATAHDSARTVPSSHVELHNMTHSRAATHPPHSFDEHNASVCTVSYNRVYRSQTTTLLGTAKIKVIDCYNQTHYLRCLVDPGSQSDYISIDSCKRLSLPICKQTRYTEVQGIGGASQNILGITAFKFTSRFDNKCEYSIRPMIVNQITSHLPDSRVDASALHFIRNLPLADDEFSQPGPIDVLLGVKLYCEILLSDKVKSSNDQMPSAFETTLGYLIMGDAPIISPQPATRSLCAFTSDPLHQIVERFWAAEEVPSRKFLSPDDQQCENIYTSTTVRNSDGSYSVDLPFKEDPQNLGNSYTTAKKRFLLLEKKFAKDSNLKIKYDDIFLDYLNKGILSRTAPEECDAPGFYLPHHPVVRDDKSTTKVRPVLDGSAKTDTGLSLNDILYTGCNLQADIFHILLNVRIFRIAFFADVKQMYLCIHTNSPHRKYQRILYRFSETDPLEVFEFTRVTFGLRSSPFLALRTLRQLANDERHNWPNAASVLERDIYMDDLASSASSLNDAVKIAHELIQLFKSGGFDLVKWTSNSLELLEHIPESHRQSESISFDDGSSFKILGLRWLPAQDTFVFEISSPPLICTKRAILSATARLYDVLGLVGPIILFAKLIIKELWLLNLDWDDVPPSRIINLWQQYLHELPQISRIAFPRHIGIDPDSKVSLVGFSDASESAYGCVIYLHVVNGNMPPIVSLLCSKSRVASAKPKITLARLELNGILLLSRLLKEVYDTMSSRHQINNIFIFSDSEVALCWSIASPHRFNTYVANRISQIQENISPDNLYHVPGVQNPADCVSRGLTPAQLVQHELWFQGPSWLSLPIDNWPIQKFSPNKLSLPEEKTVSHVTKNVDNVEHPLLILASRCSSWNKLLRTAVYMMRFMKKLPRNNIITANDLNAAELEIIRAVQSVYFSEEIKNISNGQLCSSKLIKLYPFLCDGILRVGGRLSNSTLDYSSKHPILLPKQGHIIELLIDSYHRDNFHAGPQLLTAILRSKYWIISARRIVRQRIHKCNTCFRLNPKSSFPLMADLPKCRLEQCKAFLHTGVDYAGPLYITPYRKRGVRSVKAYLCLFICLVTKAVHLELVSSLTSTAFIDAFKRFISRRGPCTFLYSDNGTNFVASKSYFNELYEFLKTHEYYQTFSQELAKNRIVWTLNVPKGSHFGGIWESNIKCTKALLFRVIGNQILTFEEMSTVLTQIEALLNSRPLYVLSSDPSEPLALTPSHFLCTAPLEYIPAADLTEKRTSLLSRFSLMDSLVQSYWKRFKSEYLHNLQLREKWNTPSNPIKVGTVVLLNVENAPPLQWPLGIITNLYPGKDGVARVAEVKTKTGTYKRPVVRLCPLPTQ